MEAKRNLGCPAKITRYVCQNKNDLVSINFFGFAMSFQDGHKCLSMYPSEYLTLCYVASLNVQQTAFAKRLQVSKSAVSRLLSGDADLSSELVVWLSYVFPLSAEAWMEIQTQHSLKLAREALNPAKFEAFPVDVFADDVMLCLMLLEIS